MNIENSDFKEMNLKITNPVISRDALTYFNFGGRS